MVQDGVLRPDDESLNAGARGRGGGNRSRAMRGVVCRPRGRAGQGKWRRSARMRLCRLVRKIFNKPFKLWPDRACHAIQPPTLFFSVVKKPESGFTRTRPQCEARKPGEPLLPDPPSVARHGAERSGTCPARRIAWR